MLGFRVWVAAALLSLAACSGADAEEPDVETPEEASQAFCRSKCEADAACGDSDPSCESLCLEDVNPSGFRERALADVGACVAQEDCAVLASDLPFEPCFDEVSAATAMAEPTHVLIDYCESAAKRYFECNIWWSVDDCVVGMALWTDDVLIEAGTCLREPCHLMGDCETEVFDKYR